jgi:hypothetical protein
VVPPAVSRLAVPLEVLDARIAAALAEAVSA